MAADFLAAPAAGLPDLAVEAKCTLVLIYVDGRQPHHPPERKLVLYIRRGAAGLAAAFLAVGGLTGMLVLAALVLDADLAMAAALIGDTERVLTGLLVRGCISEKKVKRRTGYRENILER